MTLPATAANDNYYYVTVTDGVTTVTSQLAHIIVTALPASPVPSITGPSGVNVDEGDPSPVLEVEVSGSGGGTLSYQWYRNTLNDNTGGSGLLDKTNSTYTVSTGAAENAYYYVVVTNTVAGMTPSITRSSTAHVIVNVLPSAPEPSISTGPADADVNEGAPSPLLSVVASGTGTLSYQWYRNTLNNNTGGSEVSGQTASTYSVPTGGAENAYYYVVVTNTVAGQKPSSTRSSTAHVIVNALPVAPEPLISTGPADADVNEGAPSPLLSVVASGTGTLSYQWYRNTVDNNSGGYPVLDQSGSTYAVPTGAAQDSYYYVEVTNTVVGMKPASIKSGTAHVVVNDVTPPTVTISSGINRPTAQATFGITILFSEPVTGFSAAGISVNNGSIGNFQQLSNLMYTADITATANGPVTINIAADAAEDNSGNGNTAATPHVVTYDTVGPTVNIFSLVANPTNQLSFVVTLAFNEPPLNFSADDIAVTNGTASQLQSADGLTYTAVIRPTSDGTVTVNLEADVVNDAAGNTNTTAPTPFSTVYDGTAPTVAITSTAANPTNQSPFSVTITFSETVNGFELGDLVVNNGGAGNLQTVNSRTYTADITPTADGQVTVNIAAGVTADAAGNFNTAAAPYSTVYDATAPTVAITSAAANPTNQSPFSVTITFSEAVNGFELGDLVVNNGGAGNLQTVNSRTYTADITPTADGQVTVNLAAGVAADAAGNFNTAAAPYSTVYDATAPVLTSVSIASNNATPSLAKVGDTVTVTFSVSEMLRESLEVTIAGHAVPVTVVDGVYTAVYTMTNDEAEGAIPLRIVFSDIAGNEGTTVVDTTDASSVVFDKTPPEPVIVSPRNKAEMTNSRPEIKGTVEPGSTVTITINGKESHVQADSNGEWRYRPENGLPDGKHTFTVKAVDLAGNSSEVQAELIIYIYTEYTPDAETSKENDTYADVLINGQPSRIGKLITSRQNGQSVATLTIDERELERMLAGAGTGAVLTIPLNTDSDVLIGQLNAQLIKNLEQMQAVVEFKTKHATYTLPAQQFNIDTLSEQFANPVNLQDITIQIEIAAPTTDMVQLLERAAEEGAFTVVASPMSFSIKVSYAGTSTEISKFNLYVERTIALPDGTDPSRITTGVVVEPDGTIRHVPTRIEASGGSYIARINSLTNSTYALVWHPLEFDDMANHWAKDAVNDMGSRMVINGTGNGRFSPDNDITRAEFAAIIVRGLGLKLENDREAFSDVKSADWYSDAVHVAYAYDLIDGFEDGTFRPNDKITREQAMAIIAKAMKITNGPAAITMTAEAAEEALRSYTDAADASAWARSGIASSVKSGVVSGRSESLLAPKANITRAEVAVIIERLLKQAGLI
ncbi:Ig-like domain-containing protein [Paenibacillus contaminans]|uniref:Ig-like domain-containing protein n=1 Tax=Paenibacillus contaminans TaxID=450362 RepID=UPI0013143C66|nr:Ig-like domain-containing protein [Paenibacillus contaminans]